MYIANSRAVTQKKEKKSIIEVQEKEREWNHIKCFIKPQKAEEEWKTEIETENKGNK